MDGHCLLLLIVVTCTSIHEAISATWIADPSVADIQVISGRLGTATNIQTKECMLDCYLDTSCVSIGYNPVTSACQMYSMDLSDFTYNVIGQSNTMLYKAVCPGRSDYVYLRSLNLCIKRYTTVTEDFTGARKQCSEDGGALFTLDNSVKRDYFMNTLHHIHDTSTFHHLYLIGGRADGPNWVWDNTSLAITAANGGQYWAMEEPKGQNGACVALQAINEAVYMKVVDCASPYMFICSVSSI